MTELNHYKYRGARALVLLHERHFWLLLETWKRAKEVGISLPVTDDPDYRSLETLLHHILRAGRGYMKWICEKLELVDPEIREVPPPERVEAEAADYLTHLLEKWRLPLAEIEEERFYTPSYQSAWGANYCIDAMLEHAVMHPIRHVFQLEELIGRQSNLY
jgi:hypothetical protein